MESICKIAGQRTLPLGPFSGDLRRCRSAGIFPKGDDSQRTGHPNPNSRSFAAQCFWLRLRQRRRLLRP